MPDITKEAVADYYEIVSQYLFFRKYPSLEVKIDEKGISNLEYHEVLEKVIENFEVYYGEFLSAVLRDIPAVIIPLQRMAQNPYLNQLFDLTDINRDDDEFISISSGNSVARYFFTVRKLLQCGFLGEKSQCFLGRFKSICPGMLVLWYTQENTRMYSRKFTKSDLAGSVSLHGYM